MNDSNKTQNQLDTIITAYRKESSTGDPEDSETLPEATSITWKDICNLLDSLRKDNGTEEALISKLWQLNIMAFGAWVYLSLKQLPLAGSAADIKNAQDAITQLRKLVGPDGLQKPPTDVNKAKKTATKALQTLASVRKQQQKTGKM